MNAPPVLGATAQHAALVAVPSLERKRLRAYIILICSDFLLILSGFVVGGVLYRGEFPDPQALLEAQLFTPVFLTIGLYNGVYSIRSLTDARHATLRVFMAVVVAASLLNFLAFYAKFNTSFSRGTFTLARASGEGAFCGPSSKVARCVPRSVFGHRETAGHPTA